MTATRTKRPQNSFMLFRAAFTRTKSREENNDQKGVSKAASIAWKALSESEKKKWKALADKEADEHRLANPGYRYVPGPTKQERKEAKAKETANKKSLRAKGKKKLDKSSAFPNMPPAVQATAVMSWERQWAYQPIDSQPSSDQSSHAAGFRTLNHRGVSQNGIAPAAFWPPHPML
ncbi:hypothetical protein FA15DRAFT_701875 [Coprinopsis marcescibilis]|uniref:HMG box domain-containing protein n=1 Tax=Coprinopsis marcescibilis TaxID=230819 RepID=A0A5C3L4I1_COPMA|nr:hypothetical protein FA15DRAFT_701875 [Coprinopsis marcescibilis]